MKKLILIFVLAVLLASCTNNIRNDFAPPEIEPYVVTKIVPYTGTGGGSQYAVEQRILYWDYRQPIIFVEANGKFAIGDTVNISFYKK